MSVSVVYDTMLFLQSASRPDRVHASFAAIRDGRVTLCLSAELMAEVQDVLTREALRAKFRALTPEAVRRFIADIMAHGQLFDVPSTFTWPQHPDDDHLFNLAIQAQAKYLVTWETRLLELPNSQTEAAKSLSKLAPNLAIVTPKALSEILKAS